jgi:CRP/FNR family transcriptional regulator
MLSAAGLPRQTMSTSHVAEAEAALSLASVFSDKPIENFATGAALFWEGDQVKHVFEVVEGVLRIFKILSDGRRAITGFLYPGDLVGVSMRDVYLYNAEAVTPVKVRRFASASFQEAINVSPELRPQLFAKLCDEMAAAQDQMVLLSRKNAEERICTFLLLLAKRVSPDNNLSMNIEIPMTRLDMADYLGLTIETVSRTITSLIGRGIITQSGRHDISIKKLDTMLRLAGNVGVDEPKTAARGYTRQAVWPS